MYRLGPLVLSLLCVILCTHALNIPLSLCDISGLATGDSAFLQTSITLISAVQTSCFQLSSISNVVIDGNGLRMTTTVGGSGINVQSASNVVIKNFVFNSFATPVLFQNCDNCQLINCTFDSLEENANAVTVQSSSGVIIRNNTFQNYITTNYVVRAYSSNNLQITGNTLTGLTQHYSTTSFWILESLNASVTFNTIQHQTLSCYSPARAILGDSTYIGFLFDNSSFVCNWNTIFSIQGLDGESCNKYFVGFQAQNMDSANGTLSHNTVNYALIDGQSATSNSITGFVGASSALDVQVQIDTNIFMNLVSESVIGISILDSGYTAWIFYNSFSQFGCTVGQSYNILALSGSPSDDSIIFGNDVHDFSNTSYYAYYITQITNFNVDYSCYTEPNYCYPESKIPCCNQCAYTDQCAGNFGVLSYHRGTCTGYLARCSNFSSIPTNVTFVAATPNPLNIQPERKRDTLARSGTVTLIGVGLKGRFPSLTVFDAGIPISSTLSGNTYSVQLIEGIHYLTISLNGTYDPTQPTVDVLASSYVPGFNTFYSSRSSCIASWGPYNGPYELLWYNVLVMDAPPTFRYQVNVTSPQVSIPNFIVGQYYYVMVTPVLNVGVGVSGYTQQTCADGPLTVDIGSGMPDTAIASSYDSKNKQLYVIGETQGSFIQNVDNQGGNDVFILRSDLAGNVSVWAQYGTTGDDRPAGIVYTTSGCVYAAGFTTSKTTQLFVLQICSLSTVQYFSVISNLQDIASIGGIAEGPNNTIWIAGTTDGFLNGSLPDGVNKSFVLVYDSAIQEKTRCIWSVSAQDEVSGITSNLDDGVMYVVGTTVNGGTSGFVSQFSVSFSGTTIIQTRSVSQNKRQTGAALSLPKTFIFTNTDYIQLTSIAYSSSRNLLAMGGATRTGTSVSYISTSGGLIADYVGCFSLVENSPNATSSDKMTVDTCRQFCVDFKYSHLSQGTECLCTDTFLPDHAVGEENCNVQCGGDGTEKCGGGVSVHSVYNTPSSVSIVQVETAGIATAIAFVPTAEENVVLVFSMYGYSYFVYVGTSFATSDYTVMDAGPISSVTVDPISLEMLFAGTATTQLPGQPFYGGLSDAYVTIYDPPSKYPGTLSYGCSDFQSVHFHWDPPMYKSDFDTVTYTLWESRSSGDIQLGIFNDTLTYTLNTPTAFDRYYYVVASTPEYTVQTNTLYTAKIIGFGDLGSGVGSTGSPIIRWNTTGEVAFAFGVESDSTWAFIYQINPSSGVVTKVANITMEGGTYIVAVDMTINNNGYIVAVGTYRAVSRGPDLGSFLYTCSPHFECNLVMYVATTLYMVDWGFNNTFYAVGADGKTGQISLIYFSQGDINTNIWITTITPTLNSFVWLQARKTVTEQIFIGYWADSIAYLWTGIPQLGFGAGSIGGQSTSKLMFFEFDDGTGLLYAGLAINSEIYQIFTYNISSGEWINSNLVSFNSLSSMMALSPTVRGGFWKPEIDTSDESAPTAVMELYRDSPTEQESQPINLPLFLSDYNPYDFTINNTECKKFGIIISGGTGRTTNGYYAAFINEPSSTDPITFTPDNTSIYLSWLPPFGVLYSNKDSLSYQLQMLNSTTSTWKQIYNGTATSFFVSPLLPAQTYQFKLVANSLGKSDIYPNLTVNTLSANAIYALISGYATMTVLDSQRDVLHLLDGSDFTYTVLNALNGSVISKGDIGNVYLQAASVDSEGVVHIIGTNSVNSAVVLCSYLYTSANSSASCSPINTLDGSVYPTDIYVLPNDEVWALGSTDGAIPNFAQTGGYDWFLVVNFGKPDVSYIQWGLDGIDAQAQMLTYNPTQKLLYVLGYDRGHFGVVLTPTIHYVNVSSRSIIGQFSWLPPDPVQISVYKKIEYNSYTNSIIVLAQTQRGDRRRDLIDANAASVTFLMPCDSNGFVTSAGSVTYYDQQVVEIQALPYGSGVGVAGTTNVPFLGNLQTTSNYDIYFGPNNAIAQYGFAGSESTAVYAYIVSPKNYYQYVVAVIDSGISVRIEKHDPIGKIEVVDQQPSQTSLVVTWNREANVPSSVAVGYTVTITDPNNSSFVLSFIVPASVNSTFSLPATGLSPQTVYVVTIASSLGQTIQLNASTVPLVPSVQFGLVTTNSVQIFVLGDLSYFLLKSYDVHVEVSLDSFFAPNETFNNTNLNDTIALSSNKTYYFRVVAANYPDYYPSNSTSITTLGSTVEPPTIVWASQQNMFVNWIAVAFPTTYTVIVTLAADPSNPIQMWSGNTTSVFIANLVSDVQYVILLSLVDNNQTLTSLPVYGSTAPLPSISFIGVTDTIIGMQFDNISESSHINYTLQIASNSATNFTDYINNVISGPTFTITNLAVGTVYYFRISMADDYTSLLGLSNYFTISSSITTWIANATQLTPPAPVLVWKTTTKLMLTFNQTFTGNYTININNGISKTTFNGTLLPEGTIITGLAPNTAYIFTVTLSRVVEGTFESSQLIVNTLPNPILTASNVLADRMTINWDNVFPDSETYILDIGNSTSSYVPLSNLTTSNGSLDISSLKFSTSYYFRIRLIDPVQAVDEIDFVITTLAANVPQAPQIAWISHHSISLIWGTFYQGQYTLQQVLSDGSLGYSYSGLAASTIVRNLTPNTTYVFQIQLVSVNGTFNSSSINVTTYPWPTFTFVPGTTSISVSWTNVFPDSMFYGLMCSYPVLSISTLYLNSNNGTQLIENVQPGTTYSFQLEITDEEGINDYSPLYNVTTKEVKYTSLQTFKTSGLDFIYATAVDPTTGTTYSLCFTSGSTNTSENGDYILVVSSDGTSSTIRYNASQYLSAQKVTASVVGSDGVFRFAGRSDKMKLCSLVAGVVSCVSFQSSSGDDNATVLLQDTSTRIWLIGTTSGRFSNNTNAGAKDIFAIIVYPNTSTVSYMQWGTIYDDVPTSATIHSIGGKIFVGGYSSGNFSGPSFATPTGFITAIPFTSTPFTTTTTQWNLNVIINGLSIDAFSNALVMYGTLTSTQKRSTTVGFVGSFLLSSFNYIIDSTFSYFTFGSTSIEEHITCAAFDTADSSVVAAGYQFANQQTTGIYYKLIAGSSPAYTLGVSYVPSSVVYNPVDLSTNIFGTVMSNDGLTDIFQYSILQGGPVAIIAPQAPVFGQITTSVIEILWLTPLASQYTYTLWMFNGSSTIALQIGQPNYFVLTNLTSNTEYTFAVSFYAPSTGTLYSPNATATTVDDCAGKPIRCQSGICVASLIECVANTTTCSEDTPYRCSTGECKSTPSACLLTGAPCLTGYRCWNGACVSSVALCDVLPSCPILKRRCPDGSCAVANATCTGNCTSLCPDGSCPPCTASYGCPFSAPILCPNGTCVSSELSCHDNCTNSTYYRCYNNSCVADYHSCDTPPRMQYPIPFSYTFPIPATGIITPTNITIPILSTSLLTIATVVIPPSIFAPPSPSPGAKPPQYTLAVNPVADSSFYNVGFGNWPNASLGATIYSSVVSFSIEGLSQLPAPVIIIFENDIPPDTNISNLCLAFINRTSNQWTLASKVQVHEGGMLIGNTSHFTEFTVMFGVAAPKANTIDSSDFYSLADVNKSTVGIYIVSFVLGVYLVALVFTIRHDRRKRARSVKMESPIGAGSIALSTLSAAPSSDLNAEDNSTQENRMTETPSHKSVMIKPEDGKLTDAETGQLLGLKEIYAIRFPENHSWLAVYYRPVKRVNLTHTDLLTLLFCMIWANLFVSAFFYHVTDAFSVAQKIVNGIVVACIVFPITIFFSILFHKTPRKFKWIVYVLAIAFYLVCAILTLIETIKFGNERTKGWLISICVSTVQDGVFNQPIKLAFTTLVILLFPSATIISIFW